MPSVVWKVNQDMHFNASSRATHHDQQHWLSEVPVAYLPIVESRYMEKVQRQICTQDLDKQSQDILKIWRVQVENFLEVLEETWSKFLSSFLVLRGLLYYVPRLEMHQCCYTR